jgi:enoyl-CoA hydratase/carnithine racemase
MDRLGRGHGYRAGAAGRQARAAADREVGLIQQVVTPMVRQRHPEGRARAEEVAREIAALSVTLHATLVKAGLRPGLGR